MCHRLTGISDLKEERALHTMEVRFLPFPTTTTVFAPASKSMAENSLLQGSDKTPVGGTARGNSPNAQHSQKEYKEKSTLLMGVWRVGLVNLKSGIKYFW